MNIKLIMFQADGARKDFDLSPGVTTIGRKEDCTIRIPLAVISRRHAELQWRGSELTLRDLGAEALRNYRDFLGDRLYRRCRHVISENQRVREAFAALERGDFEHLGLLVSASHTSLRDDYEVSCDGVDQLVEIADASEGVFGSRMVGAGFGGCVLSIVASEKVATAARRINRQYGKMTGREGWSHIVQAASPAQRITDGA